MIHILWSMIILWLCFHLLLHGVLLRFVFTKKNILITDLYYFYSPDRRIQMHTLLYRKFSQKQLFHELNIDFNIKQITLSASICARRHVLHDIIYGPYKLWVSLFNRIIDVCCLFGLTVAIMVKILITARNVSGSRILCIYTYSITSGLHL